METHKKRKTVERIYIDKVEFLEFENQIRLNEHLRRYAAIRRFCYGAVLDFACGCGYGTYLISVNPDVSKITGVDIDAEAIKWAKNEFGGERIDYVEQDIKYLNKKFDTLVCLETIEHIQDISVIAEMIERCSIDQLIFSFPDKKSTHFNEFHFHDFVVQDIIDLFPAYVNYFRFKSGDVQFVLFIKLPKDAPPHIFRYISDL